MISPQKKDDGDFNLKTKHKFELEKPTWVATIRFLSHLLPEVPDSRGRAPWRKKGCASA